MEFVSKVHSRIRNIVLNFSDSYENEKQYFVKKKNCSQRTYLHLIGLEVYFIVQKWENPSIKNIALNFSDTYEN